MIIQYCYTNGSNKKYFEKMLDLLADKHEVILKFLHEYAEEGNKENVDVLIYHTFPNDKLGHKFKHAIVKETDRLFLEFKGPKLLLDSHDNGDLNGFERFGNKFPRIKCTPTDYYLRNFEVVCTIAINSGDEVFEDEFERDIPISFQSSVHSFDKPKYPHYIRECVRKLLDKNFPSKWVVTKRTSKDEYIEGLKKTKIVVGCPGFGTSSDCYMEAFRTGALLFAHNSLGDVKFYPHVNLVEGTDYIGYNQFNFVDKLIRLLEDEKTIEKVRKSGRKKFKKGYDIAKSARNFEKYLQSIRGKENE